MFLIITTRSVYHEGDERSKTNPGHGYPAYSEDVDAVQEFSNDQENEFKTKVQQLTLSKKSFKAYSANRLTVTTLVQVEINKEIK